MQCIDVERSRQQTAGKKHLDLGAPNDPFVGDRVIQRLDAEVISSEQQLLVLLVVQREREHAVQAIDTGKPEFLVSVNDRFCIAVRREMVAAPLELGPLLPAMLDFYVEKD